MVGVDVFPLMVVYAGIHERWYYHDRRKWNRLVDRLCRSDCTGYYNGKKFRSYDGTSPWSRSTCSR